MYNHGKSKLKDTERVRREHRIDYQIEVQNKSTKEWYIRRYGLESLEAAHQYLREHRGYICPEPMRILKCEWHSSTSIVEDPDTVVYENAKTQIYDALIGMNGKKDRKKVLQHFLDIMNRRNDD